MKKIISTTALVLFSLTVLSASAQAELLRRGPGLVYDSEKNLTWYEVNLGRLDYPTADTYVENLQVKYDGMIYDDWRLPAAPANEFDLAYGYVGYNNLVLDFETLEGIDNYGELAYLFHKELGNFSLPAPDENGDYGLINSYPFKSLLPAAYWTSDEGGLYPNDNGTSTYSWYFSFLNGFQGQVSKASTLYVIAVRDGDIGAYAETNPDIPEICGDGIDNDDDGLIDCADHYDCDDVFNGVYFCAARENKDLCGDGFDNDGDGRTDCEESNCCGTKR